MGPTMKDRMMSNRWFKSAAALLFTLALSVPLCAAAGPQKTFATPEIAVEALVDSLVAPGHPSTPGYTDPAYALEGRKVERRQG